MGTIACRFVGTGARDSTDSGLNLSLAQLNQIQANPLNYLWSAPKTNDADYAYLIFALGRLANNDLSNAFQMCSVLPKVRHKMYKNIYIVR